MILSFIDEYVMLGARYFDRLSKTHAQGRPSRPSIIMPLRPQRSLRLKK